MDKQINTEEQSFWYFLVEIFSSPINFALLIVIVFLLYKIWRNDFGFSQQSKSSEKPSHIERLPELKANLTRRQLAEFDGTQPDGRVLLGCNNIIFDVTKGKQYYGPGGPYSAFAGRDATLNLARFDVSEIQITDDIDISVLTEMEMESVREWEGQFRDRYAIVGNIIREDELEKNDLATVKDLPDDLKNDLDKADDAQKSAKDNFIDATT